MSLLMHIPTSEGLLICVDKRHSNIGDRTYRDDGTKFAQVDNHCAVVLCGTVGIGGGNEITPIEGFISGTRPVGDFAVMESASRFFSELPPSGKIHPTDEGGHRYMLKLIDHLRTDLFNYLRSHPSDFETMRKLPSPDMFTLMFYLGAQHQQASGHSRRLFARGHIFNIGGYPSSVWCPTYDFADTLCAIGATRTFYELLAGSDPRFMNYREEPVIAALRHSLSGELENGRRFTFLKRASDPEVVRLGAQVCYAFHTDLPIQMTAEAAAAALRRICEITNQFDRNGTVSATSDCVLYHPEKGFVWMPLAESTPYKAERSGKTRVLTVRPPGIPTEIGRTGRAGYFSALDVDETTAVIGGCTSILIVSIEESDSPRVVAELSIKGDRVEQVLLSGKIAYILTDKLFTIVDVSDRPHPKYLATHELTSHRSCLFIIGTKLYIPGRFEMDEPYIFDVSNPGNPKLLATSSQRIYGNPIKFFDQNRALVLRAFEGLLLMDLSDADRPLVLEQLGDVFGYDVTFNDSQFAVAAAGDGLITGSFKPRLSRLATCKTPEYVHTAVMRDNGIVYALIGRDGICIVDVTDPAEPELVDVMHTGGWTSSMRIMGDRIYISGSDALMVFKS